jgi:uncharacterized protein (TIGR03435 family)
MRTEVLAVGVLGGSSLGERIELLLSRHGTGNPARSQLLAGLLAATLAALAIAFGSAPRWIALAQRDSFEVASIKPGDPSPQLIDSQVLPGGRFTATNLTLKELIGFAYDLRPGSPVLGGPGWAGSDRFSIEAKADNTIPFPLGPDGIARIRPMVQSLLEERFKLRVHMETKEEPVYELVVAKGGPKLKEADSGSQGPRISTARGPLAATAATMAFFAKAISGESLGIGVGRTVVDKTGLNGRYDFTLRFTREGDLGGPLNSAPDPDAPSIFTALQEQLGLKLESAKGLVDILFIDHAERPEEN